ncbi:hypothetical protein JOQ06_002795 [Pogonophryne albipinna]|uniref:Uncharacterized protein n=1 Tax=Pogonophryne albipinna TaxID=1090488 RepID=A0AAD6B8G9_9TELE|nr:hypothetical protein JOQ06_002795 [Pogonophryne albipinna]
MDDTLRLGTCSRTTGYISDELSAHKARVGWWGTLGLNLEAEQHRSRVFDVTAGDYALILLADDGGCKCGTCLVTELHSLHDNLGVQTGHEQSSLM